MTTLYEKLIDQLKERYNYPYISITAEHWFKNLCELIEEKYNLKICKCVRPDIESMNQCIICEGRVIE